MKSDNPSYLLLSLTIILVCVCGLTSCGLGVTKGDVRQEMSKVIRIGMDKSEVIQHLNSLEINGVVPLTNGYVQSTYRYTIAAPDGNDVEVAGRISASFSNGIGGRVSFCPTVGAIFYFDRSEKLINYHIDCFG